MAGGSKEKIKEQGYLEYDPALPQMVLQCIWKQKNRGPFEDKELPMGKLKEYILKSLLLRFGASCAEQ